MLFDITIGRYIEEKSVLHSADARVKIVSAIIYSAAIIIAKKPLSLAFAGAFTIVAILLSKIPFKYILKGLKPIRWFVLFTFLMNLIFSTEGNIIWQCKVLHITDMGIINAISISVRFLFFIAGTSLLTLTTEPVSLTDGLSGLMKPLKKLGVPTDDIAMIISITLRFIPMFADEAEKIIKAQSARGADFKKKGIISKIKSIMPITIPLFVSVFRHSDELALAMETRCYGKGSRKPRKRSKFDRNDALILSVMILFCGILLIL